MLVLFLICFAVNGLHAQIRRVSALGRIGDLGGLYDANTETIITGHSAFIGKYLPDSAIRRISIGDTSCTANLIHNQQEKNEVTGMTTDTELSIYSGLVSPSGSAQVYKHFRVKEDSISALLSYKHRSYEETLVATDPELKTRFDSTAAEFYKATHLITGIEWGGTVNCGYHFALSDMANATEFRTTLSAQLQLVASKLETNTEYSAESASSFRGVTMEANFYSDIALRKSTASSWEEMCSLVNEVPEAIRTSINGKGRQMVFIIEPIDSWKALMNGGKKEHKEVAQDVKFQSKLATAAREAFEENDEILSCMNELQSLNKRFPFLADSVASKLAIALNMNQKLVYKTVVQPQFQNMTVATRIGTTRNLSAELDVLQESYKSASDGGPAALKAVRFTRDEMRHRIDYYKILRVRGLHFLAEEGTLYQVPLKYADDELFVMFIPGHLKTEGQNETVEKEQQTADVYGKWQKYLAAFIKVKGRRFIADCTLHPYNECRGINLPLIIRFSSGLLSDRNVTLLGTGPDESENNKLAKAVKFRSKNANVPYVFETFRFG